MQSLVLYIVMEYSTGFFFDYEYLSDVEYLMDACEGVKEIICLQQRKQHFSTPQIHREYRVPTFEYTADPAECALVIFTSGTTGQGKGVMLSHRNLIDNTFNYEEPEGADKDTCLNVLPIHHVFCITCDILTTARYGGNVALNPEIAKLGRSIQHFQPRHMMKSFCCETKQESRNDKNHKWAAKLVCCFKEPSHKDPVKQAKDQTGYP